MILDLITLRIRLTFIVSLVLLLFDVNADSPGPKLEKLSLGHHTFFRKINTTRSFYF